MTKMICGTAVMDACLLLIAADTYRAAAIDQLKIWSKRAKVKLVCNDKTKEPSAVCECHFDVCQSDGS